MNALCTAEPIAEFGGERRTYKGLLQPFVAHSHSYYVFGKIREGKRELLLNGSKRTIAQGDIIVFNPGDVHSCNQICDTPLAYDSITISNEFFGDVRFGFPDPVDKTAGASFDKVLSLLDKAEIDKAIDELTRLGRSLEIVRYRSHETRGNNHRAAKLFAHIEGHLAEPLSVSEFARSEGISPYALIRAYKRMFSITPIQHLLSLRFEAARELLAKGAHVADVATELGFADQSHLTRVFKQRLGITPAVYRSMIQRRRTLR